MFEPDGPVLDIKAYVGEMYPQKGICIPDWMENIMKEFHGQ
jgi:tRNA (Thr-GGU) A37 N-methylase